MVQDVNISYLGSNNTDGLVQIPVAITNPLPTTGGAQTTLIDYNGGTNATYIGVAPIGSSTGAAAWQIKLLTYDGNNNVTAITWANGTGNYTNVWTSRASYTYS